MVYKKYIKRDGKLYGPYIYESKRVDGKVVSEYHGPRKTFAIKKYSWIFLSVAVIFFLAYFLSTFNFSSLTGKAVLNTEVNYTPNQPISGNLVISLKQGELFPSDSKIILENSGQVYEYDLKQFVSDSTVDGNFYIEGISLSGQGTGYGVGGEKTIYPPVSFTLNIYPVESNKEPKEPEPIINETNVINDTSINETPVINETVEVPVINETTETVGTPEVSNETETSPITGFFARVYNFFLGITPTGRAISEAGVIEISGQTSRNSPFIYEISGGEGVQLASGSVSAFGSNISDDNVQVKIDGNKVTVETSYSEIQEGFGNEFLGNEIKIINVNLSDLGLVLNDGDLSIKLVHGNDEIFSTNLVLKSGEATSIIENVSNSTNLNVTIEQPINNTLNATNKTIGVTFGENVPQIVNAETAQFVLTEEDKALLSDKYGDIVVQTSKSEIINGRLVKRYEIGKDWIEDSYDTNLSEKEIDAKSSIDRMKWLKDLAQRIKIKKQAEEKKQTTNPIETFSVE